MPNFYDTKLSNVQKAIWTHVKTGNAALDDLFKSAFDVATTADTNMKFLAFFFFNVTLSARVEVFMPVDNPGVAKDDEENWKLLTRDHIESVSEEQNLFCRLVFPSDASGASIKLPILDRYFLITGNLSAIGSTMSPYVSFDVTVPTSPTTVVPIPDTTSKTSDTAAASTVTTSGYDEEKGNTGIAEVGGRMTRNLQTALLVEKLDY